MRKLRIQPARRHWLIIGAVIIAAIALAVFSAEQPSTDSGHGEGATDGGGHKHDEEKAGHEPGHADRAEEDGEEKHKEKEGHIAMDAARINVAGIQMVRPSPGALSAEITAQGNVTPQPRGEAVLAARADGVVTQINRRLGDVVREGETVATVESRDASSIAAERASASARALAAAQAFEREQRLFAAGISPRQDPEAADAAKAQADAELQRATSAASAAGVSGDGRSIAVTSPISGRITAAPAVLGSYVTAGTELFRAADASMIEVQAAIPAIDVPRVTTGDNAAVEIPGGSVAAVVRSITPGVDAESRAATVLLSLTGRTDALRPGQAVRVRLTPKTAVGSDGRLIVPDEAVLSVEGRDVVFVRTSDGFQATPVIVGPRGSGRAEVISGLTAGQTIAGRGAFLLKAELGKGEAEHAH